MNTRRKEMKTRGFKPLFFFVYISSSLMKGGGNMRKLMAAIIMMVTMMFCMFLFFETSINIMIIVAWFYLWLYISAQVYGD